LPETYELVRSSALISWGVVALIGFLTYKVYRWSGHRAVPVLVGSVLLIALLRGVMISGADGMQPSGMIIVALALLAIAVAAVFHQVMQHPKWQRHVVQLTTLLCVVMMAIQVWSILNWRHAGQQMLALQARTAVTANAHPGEELALIASMQCYRGVPLYLPAGVMYDSPFSRAYPIKNIFVVPYARPETRKLTLEAYGPEEIRVRVEPRGEADDLYYPDFWRVGEEFLGTRVEGTERGYRLIATTKPDRPFPKVWIPYRVHAEVGE